MIEVKRAAKFRPVAKQAPQLDSILAALAEAVAQSEQLQVRINRLASIARDYGASWPQISEAAGITPQSAHQRWSESGRASHRKAQQKYANRSRREPLQAEPEPLPWSHAKPSRNTSRKYPTKRSGK